MIDLTNPVLLGPVQNQEHYMQGVVARRNNFVEPILEFFEDAYREFGKLTGRDYGLVSQYKTDDADTVFVSLGSAAENVEAAVDYMREQWGVKVGSIHPNVFRPFPEAAIVKALAGKKNVIILERTDEPLAGDNPMGRDIRTALHKALQHEEGLPRVTADQMPHLFAGVYGLGSRDFRPEHTLGAYEFAVGKRARKDGKRAADGVSFFVLGIDHPYEVKSDETPSLLPEGAVAVRFHSVGGWGAITTGKNLGAIIGDLNDLLYDRDRVVDEFGNPKEIIHVSANPKYGSEKKGAPTSYFMVAAPNRIRVNCDLRHVTVVLCCDPKAFTHSNPLDGMSEGGSLVWESDEEGQQAWERLPMWARQQIIEKKIRVFTLPGFDRVREIPIGELTAADRSSMRGKALLPVLAGNGDGNGCGSGCRSHEIPEGQGERTPLTRIKEFDEMFRSGYGYNQPANAYASLGIMAAGSGDTASKYVARRETPLYIAENCTQCMECIAVCPDTALPNCSQDLETVLRTAVVNYVTDAGERQKMLQLLPEIEKRTRAIMRDGLTNNKAVPLPQIVQQVTNDVDGFSPAAKRQ